MKKIIPLTCLLLFMLSSCGQVKEKALLKVMEETNKQCPMTIDEVTRMDSTRYLASDNTFHYYYTLLGKADNAAIADTARRELEKTLPETLKTIKQIKLFNKMDVTLFYIYFSEKTGQELFRVRITPEMYRE